MASTSTAALNAIGFAQNPASIAGPDYTRHVVVDVWDGTGVAQVTMHRPLSQSLLTSVILQSDPDTLQR
jgi:hypothetical protein